MISRSFFKAALLFIAVSMVSCDKDFNEIGTDIIDDDHYGFDKTDAMSIVATTHATGVVQTDGLSLNPLGVYNNPVFGTTTANFVTQVSLKSDSMNREFGDDPRITSVKLYIPYFSTLEDTESNGDHTYSLNSIYGAQSTTLDLKIHENKYFLRELTHSGGQAETERYYNDLNGVIDSEKGPQLNTSTVTSQNTQFFFDPAEIRVTETDEDGDETVTRTPPGMNIELDKAFFTEKIINAPAGVLANNNVFHNYLRGLYFKVANPSGTIGVLNMLDFTAGTITVTYTEDETTTVTNPDGTTTTTTEQDVEQTPINMTLTGKAVSLLSYQNVPTVPADRLLVKGGEGFITTIKLFGEEDLDGNGISDQIDEIKANKWLINEANLIFYVDRNYMTPDIDASTPEVPEPQRIYLYDAKNKQPIADYTYDNSTNSDPKRSKQIFGGLLKTDDEFSTEQLAALGITNIQVDPNNPRGVLYKIRVTNYVRGLILTDSTNVTLGLSVTDLITESAMHKLKNPLTAMPEIKELPKAGVMSPLGTVLYGPNIPPGDPNYNKRLKLVIYYTKPDQIED